MSMFCGFLSGTRNLAEIMPCKKSKYLRFPVGKFMKAKCESQDRLATEKASCSSQLKVIQKKIVRLTEKVSIYLHSVNKVELN